MSREPVVIVGAGQGGLQAAISLRQAGFDGPVSLIGTEPGLPYQRPPLSKAYLKDGDPEALALRPQSFFETKDVSYLPETTVLRIDRAAGRVEVSGPAGETALPYGQLILATGTRNVRPRIEGLEHACDLRTLTDARTLRDRLGAPRRIAVIGGGFIGLEFAAVALKQGHEVAVIEAAPRLMARAVSPIMSDAFAALHRGWGAELYFGQPAIAVDAGGVTLASGERVAADFVLLAAGVQPNAELAAEAGLETGNGITVDDRLRTSDPAISALGDCACFPDPRTGRPIRLESVQAATDHARSIAARIASGDDRAAYGAVPWFWSDQGDRKLQIAGYAAGPETTDTAISDTVVARFDTHGLAAVETVNSARVHMKIRRCLAAGEEVDLPQLEELAEG
ncbi:FAD-dependent oxidoreductase [Roseicyclus sp. F158]|uniref:FAD-dependent oxidoreductase n=1 Tax=Tropicimonas omnivorans TaxID=3075590 RepID=A0ABU3DH92_9RHOB|nr:FAD-dependent oxidoreductase [Roseicyclus sp. F158]MDT0683055.1 FAD-dependent oxidoreductase [Roseicyclus sp. F158]